MTALHNLKIEYVPTGALNRASRNARRHAKKQIKQLVKSMDEFGYTNPLLIDENNNLLAGHARLEASIIRGMETIPCVRLSNMSEADKRAYIIADNKLALNAEWDVEILAAEVKLMIDTEYDITVTGFDQAEIDIILDDAAEASTEPTAPEDDHPDPPPPDQVVTRRGDVWILGRHRLVCDDAKDAAAVELVMSGDQADMVITDPPYNCRISGHVSGMGRTKHREFVEASGEMSPAEFTEFLRVSFEQIERACRNGAIVFVFMGWRHLQEALAAGNATFTEFKNVCVWKKTNAGMGTFYRSQHEMVLVFKVGDAPHTNNFGLGDKGRYRTNVWTYAGVNTFRSGRMEELELHPTVKPVALVSDAIRDVSDRGQIVLDPFGGSGTTLIAAEKTGRRARLIEIDPAYCDVIIRRWQALTGKDAVLGQSGETFEDAQAQRTYSSDAQELEAAQ